MPVDSKGIVDIEELKKAVTADTAVNSVMHVNSETGAIQPIKEIANAAKAINPNVMVHSDCVQSYGKLQVNAKALISRPVSVTAKL